MGSTGSSPGVAESLAAGRSVSGLGFTEIVNPLRAEDWRVAFSHHQSHKKRARGFILVPSYSIEGCADSPSWCETRSERPRGAKGGLGATVAAG